MNFTVSLGPRLSPYTKSLVRELREDTKNDCVRDYFTKMFVESPGGTRQNFIREAPPQSLTPYQLAGHTGQFSDPISIRMPWENCFAVPNQQLPLFTMELALEGVLCTRLGSKGSLILGLIPAH